MSGGIGISMSWTHLWCCPDSHSGNLSLLFLKHNNVDLWYKSFTPVLPLIKKTWLWFRYFSPMHHYEMLTQTVEWNSVSDKLYDGETELCGNIQRRRWCEAVLCDQTRSVAAVDVLWLILSPVLTGSVRPADEVVFGVRWELDLVFLCVCCVAAVVGGWGSLWLNLCVWEPHCCCFSHNEHRTDFKGPRSRNVCCADRWTQPGLRKWTRDTVKGWQGES